MRNDLKKVLDAGYSPNTTAADVANTNCYRVTLKNIEQGINALDRYNVIPVIDDNGNFMTYICRASTNTTFGKAQKYELDCWDQYFAANYVNNSPAPTPLDDLYVYDSNVINLVKSKAKNGVVIEIGAGGLFGYMPYITDAKEKIIIEPLAEEYKKLHSKYNIQLPNLQDVVIYNNPADEYISELQSKADLIIIQNALDHTNNWAFILANIAAYSKPGSLLYLATDIDHLLCIDEGHFNITNNPSNFFRLVEQLGYELIYKDYYLNVHNSTFISIVAKYAQLTSPRNQSTNSTGAL